MSNNENVFKDDPDLDFDTTFEDDVNVFKGDPDLDFDMNEFSHLVPSFATPARNSRRRRSGAYLPRARRQAAIKATQGRVGHGDRAKDHHKVGVRVIASYELFSDMTTDAWLKGTLGAAQTENLILDYKVLDEATGPFGLRFIVFGYKAAVPAGSPEEVKAYVAAMTNDIVRDSDSQVLWVEA